MTFPINFLDILIHCYKGIKIICIGFNDLFQGPLLPSKRVFPSYQGESTIFDNRKYLS